MSTINPMSKERVYSSPDIINELIKTGWILGLGKRQ